MILLFTFRFPCKECRSTTRFNHKPIHPLVGRSWNGNRVESTAEVGNPSRPTAYPEPYKGFALPSTPDDKTKKVLSNGGVTPLHIQRHCYHSGSKPARFGCGFGIQRATIPSQCAATAVGASLKDRGENSQDVTRLSKWPLFLHHGCGIKEKGHRKTGGFPMSVTR